MMGVITSVTLEVVPAFGIRKCIYENLSWSHIRDYGSFHEMLRDKDYISFFTDF